MGLYEMECNVTIWDGVVWDGVGWDFMAWVCMGWDGIGKYGMGLYGMGWDVLIVLARYTIATWNVEFHG